MEYEKKKNIKVLFQRNVNVIFKGLFSMNNYYAKKIKNNLKFKKKGFRNLIKLEKFKLIFYFK